MTEQSLNDLLTMAGSGSTVSLTGNVSISSAVTVPASITLQVPAGMTLTVASGGSIVLEGSNSAPAKLVLANRVATEADGGGGKLVLAGGTDELGTNGNITLKKESADLTATGNASGDVFTFAIPSAILNSAGITGISNTANGKGFKSIVAATVKGAHMGINGKITFQAPTTGRTTISNTTKVKSH
jgi:hypothetical protein